MSKHAGLAQQMLLAQDFFAQDVEADKGTTYPNTCC